MNDEMHNKTGGTAFPATNHYGHKLTGMTLRDYFAARAMAAILGSQDSRSSAPDFVSEWAYKHADAMLKARKQ